MNDRKVLVVGGGREHVIIKSLKKNPQVSEIFALPGNGGIAADATCIPIGATDIPRIVEFAAEKAIDYAVVDPDDPLVLGCVDAMEEKGIPCFGPRANAAIIEGSKVFAKNLMKKYGIPTARYEVFGDMDAVLDYLETASSPWCPPWTTSASAQDSVKMFPVNMTSACSKLHSGISNDIKGPHQSGVVLFRQRR